MGLCVFELIFIFSQHPFAVLGWYLPTLCFKVAGQNVFAEKHTPPQHTCTGSYGKIKRDYLGTGLSVLEMLCL